MSSISRYTLATFTALATFAVSNLVHASEGTWTVGKFTGAVWVTKSAAQPVALTGDARLDAGDNISTGPNGRVILTRGEERILVSPNSAIGIPAQRGSGRTTITQRAGSILLDVEKKNVQHFEVETPYLAAVVKGTQFRVTVTGRTAKVDVTRGQVQVADFKTGQLAMVLPGQTARVFSGGSSGLSLSGKGRLSPIERGAPRAPSVQALAVPKAGLSQTSASKQASAAANTNEVAAPRKLSTSASAGMAFAKQISGSPKGGVRINAPIGEMKLDFHKVTKGLAHGTNDARTMGERKDSVFSEAKGKGLDQIDATGKSAGNSNGGPSSAVAASSGPNGNSAAGGNTTGNGNGNGGGIGGPKGPNNPGGGPNGPGSENGNKGKGNGEGPDKPKKKK